MLYTRFLVRLAISAILHILKHPDHRIAREKATFLNYNRNFYARTMQESFYIDIFSKSGSLNLE